MKKILLFIFPVLALCRCQDDAKTDACGVELTLTEMTSAWMAGDQKPNTELPYQESIVLYNDSTFVKTRILDGTTTEARGAYSAVTYDSRPYVNLVYDNGKNDLRTSCSIEGELIEIISPTQFKNTSWMACDGPALVYSAKAKACSEKD